MSLAYEDNLDGVKEWKNTKDLSHADESVTEDEPKEAAAPADTPEKTESADTSDRKQEKQNKRKEGGSESPRTPRKKKSTKGEEPSTERKPVAQRQEAAKKDTTHDAMAPYKQSPRGSRASTPRTSTPRSLHSSSRGQSPRSRPGTQEQHKRHQRLLIPLRTVEMEAKRQEERRKFIEEHRRQEEEENGGSPDKNKPEPAPFPERLWTPKTDYEKNPPKSVVSDRESRRRSQFQSLSPPQRSPQNGQKREFSTSALRVEWGNAPLPRNAKDLSRVDKLDPVKVEKLTEKLMKPLPRDGPKEADPPERMSTEDQEAVTERLLKPRKIDMRPKYQIIEPIVLEEDDCDHLFDRLAKPKPEATDKRKHIPAPPKRRLANVEEEKELTGRLYQKDFYSSRQTKWEGKHLTGEGYSTDEVATYDQFHKLSAPTSGRRQNAGFVPTSFGI